MTTAVSSTTSTDTQTTQSAASKTQLADDLDSFLTLLVTQLQNQDPLDPMDAHEFTSQLVQFASVEQQIYQNENLENLLTAYQAAETSAAVGYLGATVEVDSDTLMLQDGQARANYTLSLSSDKTTVAVLDSSGTAVRTWEGETSAGTHEVIWDGLDDSGNPVADGTYTFSVEATASDGSTVPVTTTTLGRVTSVGFEDGENVLYVGTIPIAVSDLTKVYAGVDGSSTSATSDETSAEEELAEAIADAL